MLAIFELGVGGGAKGALVVAGAMIGDMTMKKVRIEQARAHALHAPDFRRIAVASSTEPRAIKRYLAHAGKHTKPMTRERIRKAMIELGYADALPESRTG